MDKTTSIFQALNESRMNESKVKAPKIRKKSESKVKKCECGHMFEGNEKFCPDCGLPVEGPDASLVCECGQALIGDEKFCPGCGKSLFANEEDEDDIIEDDDEIVIEDDEDDVTDDDDEIVIDDEDIEDDEIVDDEDDTPEDDEDADDVSEGKARKLTLAPYNEDVVKYMGRLLKRYSAPAPVQRAYESKMYERCATWLKTARGVSIDPTEGFTANEAKKIRAHLKVVKAPRSICEAFDRGQYSLVATYLKGKKAK